jgi:DNA-directed RNA polymerase subunit RPC12/RpoP
MTERKDKPCGNCGGSEMITTAFDPYTEEGGVTKPCGTCGGSGIKPFVRYYNCIHCGKDVSEDHLITVSRNECKDRCPTCKNKVIAKSTCSKCSPDCQPAEKPDIKNRDVIGAIVRQAWINWAEKQTNPKKSWLIPYAELAEADKEADRQIGEAVLTPKNV